MMEALTGAFSGVLCALIAASFGFVVSKGKQFDFWILIVGAVVGLVAVQLGATYFGWQEWLYTVIALVLFEYGSKVVWGRLDGRVRVDGEQLFVFALNWATAVYIVLFLVALFLWFLPFVFSTKFMVNDYEYGKLVFRWFATTVPQIERDVFVAYLIFGFPLMGVFSFYALIGGGGVRDK